LECTLQSVSSAQLQVQGGSVIDNIYNCSLKVKLDLGQMTSFFKGFSMGRKRIGKIKVN